MAFEEDGVSTMAQKSILQRLVRVLSVVAVLAMLCMMLIACGEEDEDIGNGGNTGSGGGTPTEQPSASPTQEPASPTTNPDLIDHPTGDDEVIVKIEYAGGFMMPQSLITRLPLFVLFGNGCYVVQGPQIEIYPAPALPNLQETCLSEEGVQEILAKAKAAGLLDGDAEYGNDMIADAATTVFTVTANGQTSTVSAYALEMDATMAGSTMTDEEKEARAKLATFLQEMTGLESWIEPAMIVEPAHEYEIERMQIAVLPADSPSAPQPEGIEVQTLDWPLTTDLATFGTPYLTGEFSCGVVEGADLTTLMESLREANELTHWVSPSAATPGAEGGEEYILFLRPLFPGEEPCADPAA
jgi:hypothetical protein